MNDTPDDAAPFEPGDVVQLKSDGPPMTVVAVEADGVHVIWYGDSDDSIKSHVLPAVALARLTAIDLDDDEFDDEEEDEDDDDEVERRNFRRRGAKGPRN